MLVTCYLTNSKVAAMARSDNGVARSLQLYMRDMSASRPLSVMEERDLARLMKEGDQEARSRFIRANLRFVVAVARGPAHAGPIVVE